MRTEIAFPIYLLLDCSRASGGNGIDAARRCVRGILEQGRSDPQALEIGYFSVIRFGAGAEQVTPLTETLAFREPDLRADTADGVALGLALRETESCTARERVPRSSASHGDLKPRIVIVLCSEPTDEWETVARRLAERTSGIALVVDETRVDPSRMSRVIPWTVALSNLSGHLYPMLLQLPEFDYAPESDDDTGWVPPPPGDVRIMP